MPAVSFTHSFKIIRRKGVGTPVDDLLLFSSHSKDAMFGVMAQAYAAANNYWISVSVPAQFAETLSSGVIDPNGFWIDQCAKIPAAAFALACINTSDAR